MSLKVGTIYATSNEGIYYKILHFAKNLDNGQMNVVFCVFSRKTLSNTDELYVSSFTNFIKRNLKEVDLEDVTTKYQQGIQKKLDRGYCSPDCEYLETTINEDKDFGITDTDQHFCIKYSKKLYHKTAHPYLYRTEKCDYSFEELLEEGIE